MAAGKSRAAPWRGEKRQSWGLSIPPSLRKEVSSFALERGLSFSKAMCLFAEHAMLCKTFLRKVGHGDNNKE